MKITEVRIFPTQSKDGRLEAYATMTFDDWFVVRNVKIIKGNNGLFVAMPSRKVMDPCPKCGFKNVRGSKFCNDCGSSIKREMESSDKRQNEHMDIAHPIRQACRMYIQEQVLDAFSQEMERKKTEGDSYRPKGTDDFDKDVDDTAESDGNKAEPAGESAVSFEDRSSDKDVKEQNIIEDAQDIEL